MGLGDGALLVTRAAMPPAERQLFIATMADRRQLLTTGLGLCPATSAPTTPPSRAPLLYQQFQAMEGLIAGSSGSVPIPVNAQAWEAIWGAS